MPSCAFLKCKNNNRNRNKSSGITFHMFPQEPKVRQSWIDIIRLARRDEEWEPNKSSRICSIHFDENDMYMTTNGLRRIKTTAKPFSPELHKMEQIFLPPTISLNMFDTPQNTEYLEKISRLTHENKIIKSRIKTLRQKYALLQNKCSVMKSKVQDKNSETPYNSTAGSNSEDAIDLQRNIESISSCKKASTNHRRVLKKRKYPPSLQKFASTLNLYSPTAYKYVRRVFSAAVSHPRIINIWLRVLSRRPDLLIKLFKV